MRHSWVCGVCMGYGATVSIAFCMIGVGFGPARCRPARLRPMRVLTHWRGTPWMFALRPLRGPVRFSRSQTADCPAPKGNLTSLASQVCLVALATAAGLCPQLRPTPPGAFTQSRPNPPSMPLVQAVSSWCAACASLPLKLHSGSPRVVPEHPNHLNYPLGPRVGSHKKRVETTGQVEKSLKSRKTLRDNGAGAASQMWGGTANTGGVCHYRVCLQVPGWAYRGLRLRSLRHSPVEP